MNEMKEQNMRHSTIQELAISYVNGNRNHVRDKVKRMSKADFYFLVQTILHFTDNTDPEEIVYFLTRKP